MTNTAAKTYRDFGDTTLKVFTDQLNSLKSPMAAEAPAIFAMLKGYTALGLAQSFYENRWATTGIIIKPEDHNPFSLRPWAEDPTATKTVDILDWSSRKKVGSMRVPPYANGVIRDRVGGMMLRFPDFASGAREWRRRLFDDPNYKGGAYKGALTLEQMIDIYCPPGDVHPETGIDNEDLDYAPVVRAKLGEIAKLEAKTDIPVTTSPPKGDPPVATATYSTNVPGLPGGPLITDYPVKIDLLKASNTYQRPGILASVPRRSVQHGNGNTNSTRAGEVAYLLGGAEGRQASYHTVGDHDGVTVCIPLSEVGWHAADGAGPGNMSGYAMEDIEDADVWADPTLALRNIYVCADFMGRSAARLHVVNGAEYHWTFNFADPGRHDCPYNIRHKSVNGKTALSIYVAQWNASFADEIKRMGGSPVDTTPLKAGNSFEVSEALNLRATAGVTGTVVTVLAAGDRGAITGDSVIANNYTWWPVKMVSGKVGYVVQDWITKIVATAPTTTPAPTTPDPNAFDWSKAAKPVPIPELLETDLKYYETAPAYIKSTDGLTNYVFVADVVEAIRDTPRLAEIPTAKNPTPGKTGPDLKKDGPLGHGERFVVAWLAEDEKGVPYYVTPEPYWSRVKVDDTKRISDAPLLPVDA